ncbi:MAG TPA: tripartite tricarboxylate transporter TctB family protein [Candidatus Limnocylindria bacterium]|nr:tripartite tricarboxylate transporter TctB family protein [Candidatus Limnocylindria bacterium]
MITRGDLAPGAILVIAFGALAWSATTLRYGGGFEPGPGFAPVWLGVAGVIASAALLLLARRAPPGEPGDRRGDLRVGLAALGIAGVALAAPVVGLVLAIAAYLLFLTLAIERLSPPVALLSSGGAALIVYLVFERFLNVPFPKGPLGF